MPKYHFRTVLISVLALLCVRDAFAFNVLSFDGETGLAYTLGTSHVQRGQGYYVNGNLIFWSANAGVEVNEFNGKYTSNLYLGAGHNEIIQAQAGFGNQGLVLKLRSDITLHRLVFSVAYTRYPAAEHLSGIQIGIGFMIKS